MGAELDMNCYLTETEALNYNHSSFDLFFNGVDILLPKKELAKFLYIKVREGFLYDPFHLDLRRGSLKGNIILAKKKAWCVEKSLVLAACARRVGIPSRLGYSIVVNHIGVERLLSYLKRNEIVFHGFVELYVEGVWLKCTPSFDSRICRLSGVSSLDWDGESDSLFQPFQGDKLFMEYVHQYGVFDDVPITLMNMEMKKFYPHLFSERYDSTQFSFFHE